MTEKVRNPLYARLYPLMARGAEKAEGPQRDRLVAGLRGRVIEVGAGNGLNFPRYPPEVEEVLAVEPEPHLRRLAAEAATAAPVPVRVVDGVASHLPAGDGEFDVAVASLVLCCVRDQAAALAEIRRVLRPGGELRFYEHVAAESPRARRLQDLVTPIWKRIGGGCHLNRRTVDGIRAAGFEVRGVEPVELGRIDRVMPHVLGVALRS